jgi:hypothetical protein
MSRGNFDLVWVEMRVGALVMLWGDQRLRWDMAEWADRQLVNRYELAAGRGPQVWVFAVLAVVELVGILAGFHVWDYLGLPGKDPQRELEEVGAVGLGVGGVLYGLYFKRTWRVTVAGVVVAFGVGVSTGLWAVVLHVERMGW